jgi:hypothetical protein
MSGLQEVVNSMKYEIKLKKDRRAIEREITIAEFKKELEMFDLLEHYVDLMNKELKKMEEEK